jgi:hypothetical protein
MTLLESQYLLPLWDIVCVCQQNVSSNLVDHHGELLVQNGTLVRFAVWLVIRLSEHKSGQASFDSESFEYFKILRDLEEDVISKSVPNWIYYLHKFFWSFPHLLSIFLMWKMDFRFILNRISANVWGPPVTGSIATCPVLTGCPHDGVPCHRAHE